MLNRSASRVFCISVRSGGAGVQGLSRCVERVIDAAAVALDDLLDPGAGTGRAQRRPPNDVEGSITATASGSPSAAAVLEPVNPVHRDHLDPVPPGLVLLAHNAGAAPGPLTSDGQGSRARLQDRRPASSACPSTRRTDLPEPSRRARSRELLCPFCAHDFHSWPSIATCGHHVSAVQSAFATDDR